MTVTATRPLAVLGSYAPCVLYGASQWQPELDAGPWAHHHLPSYAFVGVREGAHQVETAEGPLRLTQGQVCFLRPDFLYRHRMAPGAELLYVAFNVIAEPLESRHASNSLWPLSFDHTQPPPRAVWGREWPALLPPPLAAAALHDLEDICHLWWRGDDERFRANHRLAHLLSVLNLQAAAQAGSSEVAATTTARALAALRGRLPPRSVAEWARLVGVSRAHLSRCVQRETGRPAGGHLRERRLQRARDLIEGADHRMDYVAWESGYRNVAALDHAFTRAFGCAPTRWRQRHRQTVVASPSLTDG